MTRTKWPFVLVLVPLVVIAVVAAWDNIEVWRFDRERARVESLGQPTTTRHLESMTTDEDETAATRYLSCRCRARAPRQVGR